MPTLKGNEASLSYVQCFWGLVSSSISVSIFHSAWLDNFWTGLGMYASRVNLNQGIRNILNNNIFFRSHMRTSIYRLEYIYK